MIQISACLLRVVPRAWYRSATDCREGGEKYKVRSFTKYDQLLGRDGQGKQRDVSDGKYNNGWEAWRHSSANMEEPYRLCIINHGYYRTEHFKPWILHCIQWHGICWAANEMGLEGGKEGRKKWMKERRRQLCQIVVPSQYLSEMPKQNKTKQRHLVRIDCGPANVRTFQIQEQNVTSDQPFQRYNKININP